MAARNQRNDGRAAEELVQRIVTVYKRNRILNLEKVEPPCRILYLPGGRQRVIWLKNPHLDFHGAWTRHGGRMLAIEVKSTLEPRLPINGNSGLTETQVDAMRNWSSYGAVVALLWFVGGVDELWIVPYGSIVSAIKCGQKSIRPTENHMVLCGRGRGNVVFDFERTLNQLWNKPYASID